MNSMLMNKEDMLKGIGLGMAAGFGLGLIVMPKKKKLSKFGKAIKKAGEILDFLA